MSNQSSGRRQKKKKDSKQVEKKKDLKKFGVFHSGLRDFFFSTRLWVFCYHNNKTKMWKIERNSLRVSPLGFHVALVTFSAGSALHMEPIWNVKLERLLKMWMKLYLGVQTQLYSKLNSLQTTLQNESVTQWLSSPSYNKSKSFFFAKKWFRQKKYIWQNKMTEAIILGRRLHHTLLL